MGSPHKCPVCDGWGKRKGSSLYDCDVAYDCSACGGTGVVWDHDDVSLAPRTVCNHVWSYTQSTAGKQRQCVICGVVEHVPEFHATTTCEG
jgi:hypothetical protein